MMLRVLLVALIGTWVPAVVAKTRVAVIGAGFAGASTAYYLNKLCEECYEVEVFERTGRVGGRVGHRTIPGTNLTVNIGGDQWSVVNEYIVELAKELGIQQPTYPGRPVKSEGLYKGPGRGWEPFATNVTVDPAVYFDMLKEMVKVIGIERTLKANYKERGNLTHGKPFRAIPDYLRAGNLDSFTSVTMADIAKKQKIDKTFIDQLLVPITRDIYDQNLTLNGLAGMAVLLSAVTYPFSTRGGNDVFVQTLLNHSKATVHLNTEVKEVGDGPTVDGKPFDRVVLATPIESTNVSFTLKGVVHPVKREYRHWYVIWVMALAANPEYLEISPTVPDMVLTPEGSTARFVKMCAEYDLPDGYKAFRFFSNYPIDDLDKRFIGLKWNETTHWPHTFPILAPTTDYQPVKLHDAVYYPNSLESAAVAMEMAITGGRNAAQLIHEDVEG